MTDMNMIPQNIEAEQSVLGGMMLDSGSDRCQTAMSMLKPESFYIRPHRDFRRDAGAGSQPEAYRPDHPD